MADQVSFGWDWRRGEYLAAERASWLLAPARPRAERRRTLASTLGLALFAAAYGARGILTPWTAAVLALLAFGLPWLGARAGEWIAPRLRARQFARQCLPAYGHTSAVLDAGGLALEWQDSSVRLAWPSFTHAAEAAEFLLLYQSPKASIYLPKRALAADQLEAARAIIQRSMAGRAEPASTAAA